MSDPVKWDPILDQFSMIFTRPYTIPNGLKTIAFPVAHSHIANTWEYPPWILTNLSAFRGGPGVAYLTFEGGGVEELGTGSTRIFFITVHAFFL